MTTRKENWISSGDIKLYTKSWIPEKDIRATILFLHGLGEHCSRYDEMFALFASHGIKVTSFDVNNLISS